jgi:hypothetical protein
MPYSTDWPERCCEQRITKPVETEQSDPHGRQRKRIKDRSRPVCCSSCLLQSQGFVPRALGLWLNRNLANSLEISAPQSNSLDGRANLRNGNLRFFIIKKKQNLNIHVASPLLKPITPYVRVGGAMRGIRFAHSLRQLRRRADQCDSAISSLMEIVFRNMAYRSVTREMSSQREKRLRSFPMRSLDCFQPM